MTAGIAYACITLNRNRTIYEFQFEVFPPEIYLKMFKYIPLHYLCRLNLVCRQWRGLIEAYCRKLDPERIFPDSFITAGMVPSEEQIVLSRRLICLLTAQCPFQQKYSLLDRMYLAWKERGAAYLHKMQVHQTHVLVYVPKGYNYRAEYLRNHFDVVTAEPAGEPHFLLFAKSIVRPNPRKSKFNLMDEIKILDKHPAYQLPTAGELRIFTHYNTLASHIKGEYYSKYFENQKMACLTDQVRENKLVAVKLNGDIVFPEKMHEVWYDDISYYSASYAVTVLPVRKFYP